MNNMVIQADLGKDTISRHVYGNFSEHLGRCIYGGFWVGEDSPIPNVRGIRKDVVAALKKIKLPNLRWPGGCFADEYHWTDGIGPRENRPTMINTHWGGVTENNHFGTHEFLDLCEQIGCEPYLCGNLGSGTVQEMSQWVEYVNFDGVSPMANLRRANGRDQAWKVHFWGVGNENWACGGQMRPEFYADQYRRYSTYCRSYPDKPLYKVACGPCGPSYDWTEVLMRECTGRMNGLALHYYCGTGRESRSATQYAETDWFFNLKSTLFMDELITKHSTIMDKYDPGNNVALVVDEWGAWHAAEPGTNPGFLYQQNTIRDAVVAAMTLDIFHKHARRVRLANIAQTVNVLQAVILTQEEKMLLTPTYHVFDMYKVHQDATLLPSHVAVEDYAFGAETIPAITASASRDAAGKVHVSMSNANPEQALDFSIQIRGQTVSSVMGKILTAKTITAHNTFEAPRTVRPATFDGVKLSRNKLTVKLPPRSVIVLEVF
ncbi:MAG: alpha-N-arabinofuranosidase [Planctomycetota bacterium]